MYVPRYPDNEPLGAAVLPVAAEPAAADRVPDDQQAAGHAQRGDSARLRAERARCGHLARSVYIILTISYCLLFTLLVSPL